MKVGFIGCGNMGGAIALSVGKTDCIIYLYDKSEEKSQALKDKIGENASVS